MSVKRKIIYSDASYNEKSTTIALYDMSNNAGFITNVGNNEFNINNSYEAEYLAAVNAIFYCKRKNYGKCTILVDSEQLENNKKLNRFKKIKISWIPREINKVADRLSKMKNNTSKEHRNILKFIFEILR